MSIAGQPITQYEKEIEAESFRNYSVGLRLLTFPRLLKHTWFVSWKSHFLKFYYCLICTLQFNSIRSILLAFIAK